MVTADVASWSRNDVNTENNSANVVEPIQRRHKCFCSWSLLPCFCIFFLRQHNKRASGVYNSAVSWRQSKKSNYWMLTALNYITSGLIRSNLIWVRASLRHLLSLPDAAPHRQRESESLFTSHWLSEAAVAPVVLLWILLSSNNGRRH